MATTQAFTSAGTKLSVSAATPATFDEAGYEALTFTEVGEITDMGEFGRVYADITHKPINTRQTFHFKGGYDDGGLALTLGFAPGDSGQALLLGFLDSDENLSVKLEFNDNPGGTNNTIYYFPAKVMSAPKQIGNVDSITGATINLMINGDIVETPAA